MPAQDAIDEAWGRLPPAGRTVETAGRYTSARMERIIQIVIAVGALVVGGQAFVASWEVYHAGVAHGVLHAVMFVAVVAMALLCVVGRGVRVAATTLAIVYPVALLAWPVVMGAVPPEPQTQPWIFYLVNFATLAAMLAFPLAWQYVWAVSMSVLYAAVRLAWGGFEAPYWVGIGYDVSFALIQGGVFVTVGWVLRSLAGGVDEARSQAVAAYARATSADAGEQERVAVAALMHDSVLAALIAAERAQSPRQRQLAVSMAREALTRLANAESDDREGSDEPVSRAWIADAVERSAAELGVPLVVSRGDGGDDDAEVVPGRVARAVVLAATQAVANAVQHADGAGLAVSVSREGAGVRVEVSDTGPGVDVAAIPADRLGIRASIFARMAAAGGEARIASGARGTRVALTWTGESAV